MRKILLSFCKDESGATAIEYGLIAALLCVVIITALSTLGGTVSSTLYGRIATAVSTP